MKKFLSVLLIVGLLLLMATPTYAQARYGTQSSQPLEATGIFIDQDGNTMDYGVWIYGITIFADANNSFMGVYDADTAAELTAANVKDEIGEATQWDSNEKWYTGGPRYYTDGVGAVITVGVGFVHYGPQP